MNPWALLVILIGIVLVIVGVKGTQHNIIGAITGRGGSAGNAPGSVTLASSGIGPVQKPGPGINPKLRTV